MHRTIPIADTRLHEDDISAATRVLRSGHLVQGPEVEALETEFAAWVDGRHCVAVNSGTSALWLTALALGIGAGDEVVLPSFTFAATAAAIRLTGATCVFADIDPHTHTLDPDAAAAAITGRTAALLSVHLYGHPADTTRLGALARRHGLALIEDAAQAHGATHHGHRAGALGTAAAFSFYPTKNMQAVEGGMITTADPALAHTLRLLRNHGSATRYHHEIVGTNARMNDVNAAIARTQLARLDDAIRARRHNATHLTAAFATLSGITAPTTAPGTGHVHHQYTIRVHHPHHRDTLAQALTAHGIGNAVHYPTPLHRQPAYRTDTHLPHTDLAATEVLSLPVHPALTQDDLDRITTTLTALTTADHGRSPR
ncbi:DegT/DnrJ/EryC1/StrS family aminotransferase [Embleya sp. NPDC005575]|uniref:DegT/DnrJ/EryC1/StrS family aminotransferase n=1 Tax=Embleya sp. NPDC005575 TaxID=3156892 RepID=UPI0033B4D993